MKKQLIVKKLFCVLALICVFVSVFAVNASAEVTTNTSLTEDDDFRLIHVNELLGTNFPITVWSDGKNRFYIRFLQGVPSYIFSDVQVSSDGNALGYTAQTRLLFYDDNMNPLECYCDYVYYDAQGALIYKTGGRSTEFNIGYYAASEFTCLQFAGTAVFNDHDLNHKIFTVKQNVKDHRNAYNLFTAADINALFKQQGKPVAEGMIYLHKSDEFSDILGYHWVSAKWFDQLQDEAKQLVDNLNAENSDLLDRIAELEKLNTDAVKAYDEGKAAAYAEYNAVSGLLDGTVNAVSSTVGYFFDNIKVGTITLGGVLSILIIFLVVVFIIRKVKN